MHLPPRIANWLSLGASEPRSLGASEPWSLGALEPWSHYRYGSPRCSQIPHLQHERLKARHRYHSLRGHPPHGVFPAPADGVSSGRGAWPAYVGPVA
ncbi:MAG: hypothetical protein IJU72_01065 [Bacteroidales bacterium]|nr:hypothetical protein [Bacteroidales bacterium]